MTLNLQNLLSWGLKLWLPLNTTYVNTNTYTPDLSGNSHAFQSYGTPVIKGQKNGSRCFDMTNGYFQSPILDDLKFGTGDFTLLFQVMYTSTGAYETPYDFGYTDADGILIQTNSTSTTALNIWLGGSSVIVEASGPSLNVPAFYALTRNGSALTLYRNGVVSGSTTNSVNLGVSTTKLPAIGARYGGDLNVKGSVWNFFAFKGTALSQGQIRALMDATYIE